MAKPDPFNAPISGESLTMQPGGAPFEQPPQFADPDEAAEYVFDRVTDKRQAERLVALLQSGVPVEDVARTIVFSGFMQGKWTVDVGMLILRPVMYQIAAIGARVGISDMKITPPDTEQNDFISNLGLQKASKRQQLIESDDRSRPQGLLG